MPADTTLALRDIHLPDHIAWWPLAPGWWIVTALLLFLLLLTVYCYRRYQGGRLRRVALSELARIQEKYAQDKDGHRLVQLLSNWLRRVCISYYPVVDVAGLTGLDWLQFLDKNLSGTSSSRAFSEGVGQTILTAPYQPESTVNGAELLSLCRLWVMKLPRQRRGRP